MVLTIFGKQYQITSDIRIVERPAKKLAQVILIGPRRSQSGYPAFCRCHSDVDP